MMNYEKPKVTVLGPAILSVKGQMSKGTVTPADNTTSIQYHTPSAYEADE